MKNYIEYFEDGKRITNGRYGEQEVNVIGDICPYGKYAIEIIKNNVKNNDDTTEVVPSDIQVSSTNAGIQRYYPLGESVPVYFTKYSINPNYRIAKSFALGFPSKILSLLQNLFVSNNS